MTDDTRRYETTPMLERILEELKLIRETQIVIQTDIAELKADVALLKADVAELKADVAVLKADVASMKASIVAIEAEQLAIRERIEEGYDDFERSLIRVQKDTARRYERMEERVAALEPPKAPKSPQP